MDGYSVKLDSLAPIMNDFIEKLQNFETLATTEKKGLAIRGILTSVEELRNSLKESVTPNDVKSRMSHIGQIERLFSEFNWDVNYTMKPMNIQINNNEYSMIKKMNNNEYSKLMICCKNLIASVMKMLGKRNCGILVVDLYFKMCIKVVNELSSNVGEQGNVLKDLLLFQMLGKGFLSSLRALKKFWYMIVQPQQKYSIMLCLNQSFKTLCFLGKVIDKRLTHLIMYLLNRLKQCFNKIVILLGNSDDQCQNNDFIMLMDSCLNILDQYIYGMSLQGNSAEDSDKTVMSLKPLIDEILYHAMTICHISNRDSDCNMIKSYSQKVLDEYKSMSEANDKADMAFTADKLSDLLCMLEETVNTSVLNVVLDVFTDVNDPVRNLLSKCNQTEESFNRSANDLENVISEFDEHMDKIMHIGLFAVSCSTDLRKILRIRSCLASLESLEAELITSVISLYLHSNPETRTTFQHIFRNWMDEVTELKNLMELILDPRAFCQVIEKRATALVNEIWEDDSVSASKIKCNLNKILSYTKKLIKTLTRGAENEEENVKKKMMASIESLQLSYQECEASKSLLDQDIPLRDMANRTMKRAVLIITSIKNIIRNLAEEDISQELNNVVENEAAITDSKTPDICNLNKIIPEVNSIDEEALTPYISRGKLRTKERTILYNTPKNSQNFQKTSKKFAEFKSWGASFRSRSRSQCCRPLSQNSELENSLDLELTELLDNVTDLSSTFKTAFQNSNEIEEVSLSVARPETNTNGNILLGTIMRQKLDQSLNELSNSSTLSIHKDSNCRYETPERMHDLTLVQQKINFIMEHLNNEQ